MEHEENFKFFSLKSIRMFKEYYVYFIFTVLSVKKKATVNEYIHIVYSNVQCTIFTRIRVFR